MLRRIINLYFTLPSAKIKSFIGFLSKVSLSRIRHPLIHVNINTFMLSINLFLMIGTESPDSILDDDRTLARSALVELLKCFRQRMPFTHILDTMANQGYECTIDDLLAWSTISIKGGVIKPTDLNNDTGQYDYTIDSAYRTSSDKFDFSLNQPTTSLNQIQNNPSSETPATIPTAEPGASLELPDGGPWWYSLLGYTGLLCISIGLSALIEYLKSKFDVNTSDDNNSDDNKDNHDE